MSVFHKFKVYAQYYHANSPLLGPALMAGGVVKALPLTASCLSPLSGFESKAGHVRKLPVTWG